MKEFDIKVAHAEMDSTFYWGSMFGFFGWKQQDLSG